MRISGQEAAGRGGASPDVLADHVHNLLMVARVFADAPDFDPDAGSPRAHHLLAALQRRVGLRQRRGRD
eukprot:749242-Alexandrium_andersonii.AAC.1